MPKRILIFSLAYYPNHVSGAESAVKEITDRIAPEDITFELVTLWFDRAQPKEEQIGNVLVHRVGIGSLYLSKILFVPMAVWTARRIYKERPLDGLWALMTYMLFPTALARFLGVRVPYVVTLQDGDPYEKVFERWFIRPFTPILDYGFRHSAVVQAISSYLAEWPRRRGAQVPVEMIYNAANPNDFIENLFSSEELHRAREELGVADTDVLIGNTARLVYQKGWEDSITALTHLPKHIKLLVVGGGPDEAKYKELAETCGVSDRTIFVGQVDRDVVTKYRRILDVFVMPSRSEGLGNAGLSAMASRIPMVATQEGGLAEYVFDEKRNSDKPTTAWAIDKDSPEQIASAVQDILVHPDKVKSVTDTAYDMVSRRHRWEYIVTDMRTRVFSRLFANTP